LGQLIIGRSRGGIYPDISVNKEVLALRLFMLKNAVVREDPQSTNADFERRLLHALTLPYLQSPFALGVEFISKTSAR
jgi:hypothetical protein